MDFNYQATVNIYNNGAAGNTVTVTNPGAQHSFVGSPVSLQIAATDSASGPTLTYSATGLPAGLSINAATGLITGTPTTTGNSNVTVTATDTTNAIGATAFTWSITTQPTEAVTLSNPGNQTTGVNTSTSLQISATDNLNKPLTYSATDLPTGLSINTSVGLISGTPSATGTFSVTVTGSSGTASGSTSFAWTVNPAGTGITNGGFETGDLTGWTVATGTASATAQPHSGSYSGQVGPTAGPAGTSSISQTFTAPAGTSTVSFWWRTGSTSGGCQLTNGGTSATLTDNTTHTTVTVLAQFCFNDTTWRHPTKAVTAGHSYTLTLTNKDDGTDLGFDSSLFDDVTVSGRTLRPVRRRLLWSGAGGHPQHNRVCQDQVSCQDRGFARQAAHCLWAPSFARLWPRVVPCPLPRLQPSS